MRLKHWWSDTESGNRSTWRNTLSTAVTYTTNPTWIILGLSPGLSRERPLTDRLDHNTASICTQ